MKFDPYSTLMINCSSCILIVFHLYCFIKPEAASQIVYDTYSECCEPCSFCNGNILSQNIIQVFLHILSLHIIHSCFENGCRKNFTRQSRKVFWVVLTSLFFKKISKNGTRGQGRNLRVLKESKKKWIRQLQCREQCIDHIRYYLSGLSSAHFFEKTFVEIAVYILGFSKH